VIRLTFTLGALLWLYVAFYALRLAIGNRPARYRYVAWTLASTGCAVAYLRELKTLPRPFATVFFAAGLAAGAYAALVMLHHQLQMRRRNGG